MKAREIMTPAPACCTGADSVKRAAELMEQHDCGCIPVVEDLSSNRLVGVVTDRDLALRTLGKGAGAESLVGDVMTPAIFSCGPEDDLAEVERVMATHQVRRVPVVGEDGRCLGIIAQADLARDESRASDKEVRHVVERISEPGEGRFGGSMSAGPASRDEVRMERHEPPYTTSGSFTAPKFGSAGSGGLEYEPLPEQHDDKEPGAR